MSVETKSILYHYLIALGSNIEDRGAHLQEAMTKIARHCGRITARARVLEFPPVGGVADRAFLNTAVVLLSTLTPLELLSLLLKIENSLGRTRLVRWANRTIDCDIILARKAEQNLSIHESTLTIPHPHMHTRDFVLIPAAEIAPNWMHPLFHKTVGDLLDLNASKAQNRSQTPFFHAPESSRTDENESDTSHR